MIVPFKIALMTLLVSPLIWVGFPHAGEMVEKTLFPVISDQQIIFIQRGTELAGWVWKFNKLRRIAFQSTNYIIDLETHEDIVDASLLV